MNIWIYGVGKRCDELMDKLQLYPEIRVKGLADSYFRGTKYGFKVLDLINSDTTVFPNDDAIVIAIMNIKTTIQIAKTLQEKGYLNIYYYLGKTKTFKDFLSGECKKLSDNLEDVIPSLEMHTVDYCNLNCAGCVHFSPLFPKETPVFEKRVKDLNTMKNLSSNIVVFSLLGGEPLLNKDIVRYMKESRKIFPNSEIQLITNGLLIPKMSEEFFTIAKEQQITIVISVYPPTSKILGDIIRPLEDNHIEYILRDVNEKSKFNRPLSLKKDSVLKKHCISDGCVGVCDGKIARCPTLLYIDKFNEVFKQNLPSKGIYSLAEFKNVEELQRKMEERVPLCDYCVLCDIKWRTIGAEARVEDFASVE